MSPKALVITHGKCTDGAFAACAARYHLLRAGYLDDDIVIKQTYVNKTPEGVFDEPWNIVFVLDTTIPEVDYTSLAMRCPTFILDHHKTNQETWSGSGAYFDMTRSGAGLAWDEVQIILGLYREKRPTIINYVEDADLYTWNLVHSRAVSAAIKHEVGWDLTKADAALMSPAETWSTKGYVLLDVFDRQICEAIERATVYGDLVVVGSPIHQSEVGNRLASFYNRVAAVYYLRQDGTEIVAQVSFRGLDRLAAASDWAVRFGGGGHRNAAGAAIPIEKWISFLKST